MGATNPNELVPYLIADLAGNFVVNYLALALLSPIRKDKYNRTQVKRMPPVRQSEIGPKNM